VVRPWAQRKGRFWPGFSWRILAHKRTRIGRAIIGDYVPDGRVAVSSEDFDVPVEFDELVIDNWLHVEQMNDRDWWIGLGTGDDGCGYEWSINVHIDNRRTARVTMEHHA